MTLDPWHDLAKAIEQRDRDIRLATARDISGGIRLAVASFPEGPTPYDGLLLDMADRLEALYEAKYGA